ncbi:MAG: carbon monoxide dehydrogenase, partial [Lentisphaeria bacterium]|nr:carbon monoxide dehydrogenase [Lentisphaeria bacterium]
RGIRSFTERRDVPVKIPRYEVEAEMGFSVEWAARHFENGLQTIGEALRDGRILGIVNLVGCNNPRVVYEKATVEMAATLIRQNVLILTNGCASFALLKLGFCSTKALAQTGEPLRQFLQDLPPVWHMGECLDNARASALFSGVAAGLRLDLKDMPYGFISPEYSNEKGICAALGFRLLGVNSYHCVEPPTRGSAAVSHFFAERTKELLGSAMVVDTDHDALAGRIIQDFKAQRTALGWENRP